MIDTNQMTIAGGPVGNPLRLFINAGNAVGTFAAYGLIAPLFLHRQLFGDRSFFSCCDASIQSYAWLGKVAAAARTFSVPLWDFGSYAGISFAGELQPGPFYPVTWFLGLLGLRGMPLADSFVVLHFAIAASAMHAWLRATGLGRPAAIAGGLIFAFSGYVPAQADAQPNIFAGLVWIPLVLLFYRCTIKAASIRLSVIYACLAGAIGAMQIVAGHLQPFIYTSYAAVTLALTECALVGGKRWVWRPLVLVLIGQTLATGFAAVPLALSYEYLHLVYRWFDDAGTLAMSTFPHAVTLRGWAQSAILEWRDFGGLLDPNVSLEHLYGSLFFTWIGLLAAVSTLARPGRSTIFFWLLAAAASLVALGANAGPIAIFTYKLPLLAQTRTPIRAMYVFSFAAACLAATGIDNIARSVATMVPRMAMVTSAALLLGVVYELVPVAASLGMPNQQAQYAPVYYNANPGLLALERLSNEGPLVDRFMAQPFEIVPPNAGDVKPVMNVLGHRGTMLVSEFDYLAHGSWGPGASDQLDRLGVRWVISDKPIDGLRVVDHGPDYVIMERPSALSAFWTVDPQTGVRARAAVESVHWGQDAVRIQLVPVKKSLRLVLAQPAFPGWVAAIDGKDVPMEKEDIFNAVVITATSREVTFSYKPFVWPWVAVSAASFLLFGLTVLAWALPGGRHGLSSAQRSRVLSRI